MTNHQQCSTNVLACQELEQYGLTEQDMPVMKLAREVLDDEEYDLFCECFMHNSPQGKLRAIRGLQSKLEGTSHAIHVYEDYIADIDNVPEPDWLVDGLVVRDGLTLLYADAGLGKTTLMLHMTDCLQKGEDFLVYPVERPYKVLWIEQDESLPLLRSHRDKIGKPQRLEAAQVSITWDGKKFCGDLDTVLWMSKADVVIIDAYTSLGITDITRPESALVFDELRRKAKQYHCAIVVLHHTNLGGGQLGSSLHRAKVDSLLSLQREAGMRLTLIQEKVRGTHYGDTPIEFNEDTLEMKAVATSGTPLKARVAAAVAEGKPQKQIVGMFPEASTRTVQRYIRDIRK